MKRVFWITLALWALAAQTVATQPPADSLCLWFERGEKGKWLQAVARWQEQAGHKIELPDPLQYATLPRSLRPAWARVSDEELWEMLQVADKRIVHLIDLRSRGTRALWTVESAQEVTMHRAAAPWRIAALAFALAGMIITGLAAYRKWSKRFDPRARLPEWQPLYDACLKQRWSSEAREQWAALRALLSEDDSVADLDRWNQLSRSEQELAKYIGQLLPVDVIARRMACSESYVYNLRSSIRKKLKLQPGQDLDVEILRLVGRV